MNKTLMNYNRLRTEAFTAKLARECMHKIAQVIF